jgi:membrane-associated phospholipid phosphatase
MVTTYQLAARQRLTICYRDHCTGTCGLHPFDEIVCGSLHWGVHSVLRVCRKVGKVNFAGAPTWSNENVVWVCAQLRLSVSHLGKLSYDLFRMPSTHSSVSACMSILVSSAALRMPLHPRFSVSEAYEPAFRILVPFVVTPLMLVICATRIWKGHHSVRQVVGGIIFGTIYGLACFETYVRFVDHLEF